MRYLVKEGRAARHMAVVDEATLEFNRNGVAGASLAAIARRVGLSRAGLYYYCTDRQDLVFQCYSRACALIQADIELAQEASGNALERLEIFLRQSVNLNHRPVAVLTDLAFLSIEQQASIVEARAQNIATLKALLMDGWQDGSIRSCELNLVCQTIFGILSWAPQSRLWANHIDDASAARMATAIPDLVINGVASEGTIIPKSRRRISDIIEIDGSDRGDRMEVLARAGSLLFNRRGIDGVSFEDIAIELEVTKGTLFHYFDNKPAFIAYCYERALNIYDRIIDVAEMEETGLECLMTAMELNIEAQLADVYPLWLTMGFRFLSSDMQVKLATRAITLMVRSVELARRGIRDGSLRQFDFKHLPMASPGTFTYLPRWLPEDDRKGGVEMAREISRLLFLGLRPRMNES